ncbi:MAG: putative capsid protein [Cressdnaviricota sp.]|nr:MAG: putative capsid protein [Cressdnaviricota sp.]
MLYIEQLKMVAIRGGYQKKPTKTKRVYKKKSNNKTMVSLIKDINIRQAETKYKSISYDWGSIVQNNLAITNLWDSSTNLFPGQNSTDSGRIGDRIICQGIKIRAIFDIPWDRKNIKLKAFYVPWNSDQGTPATYTNFFHNITGEARLDPVQKKRYPGLKYLGTYQIEPERAPYYTYGSGTGSPDSDVISANTGTICIKTFIPMNDKKLFFRSDATNQPSNLKEQGSILLVPYASLNTAKDGVLLPGDTIVLNGKMSATCYYKDL